MTRFEAMMDLTRMTVLLSTCCFDKGLLPSYAFPTDLCAFVIQEWDKYQVRMKERPQLGKGQALSEYAPGRLLVVNKLTYRVGGVYVEGRASASPAVPIQSPTRPLCWVSFVSVHST